MLKLENSIRGLSFSRVAFDLTIQYIEKSQNIRIGTHFLQYRSPFCWIILLSAIYRDLNSVIGTPFL